MKTAFQGLYDSESELNVLYEKMAYDSSEDLINKASSVQEFLESSGFYEVETTIMKVANGLGVTVLGMDNVLCELSGGQRAKVIFAKLLLEKPDVLLLDEPTNHLDVDAKDVLMNELIWWQGNIILVTHEPSFYKNWAGKVINIGD